jgi:hypothetical protein
MIVLDTLWPLFLKSQDYRLLNQHNLKFKDEIPQFLDNPDNYYVSWGENVTKIRHSVIETGFFLDAIHLDVHGLYEKASFNFPNARKIIENFTAPKPWKDLNAEGKLQSKFGQPKTSPSWDGIVAICQHHTDRSVWKAGSSGDYHQFLESIGKYYGKRVLFKKHPVTLGNKDEIARIEAIASKYGCEIASVDISVIDHAEAVWVYNSTFVVDALMRGKQVNQFAQGYFWQSGVVEYTNREIFSPQKTVDPEYVNKFIDFLIWKYCFHKMLPLDKLAEIVKIFESSKEFFPLPVELSYGTFIDT